MAVRRLLQRIDSISMKILLSYLSILLVPLCVIAVIYNASMDAIAVSRQETSLNALKETAQITSARIDELRNITSYIDADPNINAIINRSRFGERGRNIYTFHEAISALPNYMLTNQMIKNVFIFFNGAEFVIKQPNAFAYTVENYNSHVAFHGIDYDGIRALSRTRAAGTLLVSEDAGGRDVLLLRSVPYSNTPDGLIVIQLDTAMIDGIMAANDTGPGGGAYILTREGWVLSCVGDAPFDVENLLALRGEERLSYSEVKLGGRAYLLCQVQEGGLTYMTLVEKAYLLSTIAPIKYLILALGAAALLLGMVICITLWRRRSRAVRRITTAAREAGVALAPARSETHLLESTVETLASTVGTLRGTMDLQQGALRQAVVQGCLAGTFPTRADMLREVASLAPDVIAPAYHVVRVSLLSPWETRSEGAPILPYRIVLKQFLADRLPIPHVSSDIDGASFALLLTEAEAYDLDALVSLFGALSEEIARQDWAVPSFAISDCRTDLWDVGALHRQTEEITGYMALMERRGVCCAADLPPARDAMFFPVEVEIRFIQTLKNGTPDALRAMLDQIMEENLRRRTLDTAMLGALLEALRRSILRAVQEVGEGMDTARATEALEAVKSLADVETYAARAQEQISHAADAQSREEDRQVRDSLRRHIDENLSNPLLNLSMLSEMSSIPEGTLYRTFKDYFGISFSGYLEQRRITLAFELLGQQVMIKDVAERVGYTSDHTFRRAFKRVMKVPPSEIAKLTHAQDDADE